MMGILPDYDFGAGKGILPGWMEDSWLGNTIRSLEQGGSPLLTGGSHFQFPMPPPEQAQTSPAPPAVGTPPGGPIAREDSRERPYAPSALNGLPVPTPAAMSPATLPGIGDRLYAGMMGFAHGGAPLPALANLISGLITGQRADPQGVAQQAQDRMQRTATQYVAGAQDIEPNLKAAMIANPALASAYLGARARPPGYWFRRRPFNR